MINIINEYNKSIECLTTILQNQKFLATVQQVADVWVTALQNNNKIMFCGNGGSAADSQHLAAELVSRFYFDRPGLNAVALTVDTSVLTAIGNDYGYDRTFARQVEAIGQPGDVLVGISTSGRSKNVLEAIKAANNKNIITIGFLGQDGRDIGEITQFSLNIPSNSTPKIQEGQLITGHILCALVEERLFSKNEERK